MKKNRLVQLLIQEKIIKYGNFTLHSGEKSTYYCDMKQALGNVKLLDTIIRELTKATPASATCIAGSGYGGIALASLVAYKKKLPLVLIRDTLRKHGTKQLVEAYIPTKKDKACIIDDVFTTGSSIAEAKEKLSPYKCRFTKPLVVLNRSKNKSVIALVTKDEIEF